jgi:hypothetical protein
MFVQESTCKIRGLPLRSAMLKRLVNGEEPGHDPPNIGVYGRNRLAKCDTQDCACSVVSYARKTEEFVPGFWNFSIESFRDLSS